MTSASSPFSLAGRRILITGAAGGIGGATARLSVGQGAKVVLVDVVDPDRIAASVGDLGGQAEFHQCDTSKLAAVKALAASVGPVYGLVDCAAICPEEDWLADDWDETLDKVIALNIKGPLNLTRAFFPGMTQRGEGRIVMLGSVAGWMGGVRSGPDYAFSKGGIHAFVRWLARRGAPHNVLVNGIAPGPIATGMIKGRGYDPAGYPLGRFGQPEEIAAAAVFLLSPGASFVNGSIVDVNSGIHYH
jgi:NAD(P)-dependent dehydrogenase (short-subunit alcohol dehydrogenase family)